jgi:hypothetical protein
MHSTMLIVSCNFRLLGPSASRSVWPSQEQAWQEARAAAYHAALSVTWRQPVSSAVLCSASAKKPGSVTLESLVLWAELCLEFQVVRRQWRLLLNLSYTVDSVKNTGGLICVTMVSLFPGGLVVLRMELDVLRGADVLAKLLICSCSLSWCCCFIFTLLPMTVPRATMLNNRF